MIKSIIIKTQIGKTEEIALQLKRIPNVTIYGIYKNNNIIVVLDVKENEEIKSLSNYILNEFMDVISIKE